jgi:signal transduction histidine kinase/DNA-binding response OmpR family regulator
MNAKTPELDYLGQSISEMARERGGSMNGPQKPGKGSPTSMTRSVAKRLLPACVAVPGTTWWVLNLGVHRGWFSVETSLAWFVFSVAAAFGLVVCVNLHKLAKWDAERTLAQEQLQRAKENAENANRFKSAFFANISHEIRTPLTAINGFAELLMNPQRTEEEKQSDARVIRRNGEHLLTLINDILDQSKIEAGKMSVEPILCGPAAIIGEVCSMLRARAEEKGLTLEAAFEGPIPQKVRTDPTRLRQILINLVANAIKFTKEGGVKLEVSVKPSMAVPNPVLEVKITDTGIGISPEQQALLFKPFAQADATISRHYGGSGLGLAISKHLSEALGGDIALASEPGKGSTFTVTVATGPLSGVDEQENPQQAMDAREDWSGPKVRIKGSVLVAEDGIDNQALIAAKLRETGLTVEIASNGQMAMEKVTTAAKPFDLIFMDVQMPLVDGFSATLQLRSKGYRGPIIALTANAGERDRAKCLSAGCNDFVTKPIKMQSLLKAIGRYLKIAEVPKEVVAKTAASGPNKEELRSKFYQELPDDMEKIELALEREDRVQLKEAAQLMLGKSSAAELKEVAAQALRLMFAAEREQSWDTLREMAAEFEKDCAAEGSRRAA